MDSRGQPVQVGVIILFGFLVIAFALFQAVVVPQQNAEVEFQHNQEAQRDVVELRNSIVRAANAGENGAASVALGTRYPARLFGVNAGAASGHVQTTDSQPMYISGVGNPNTDYSGLCPTENRTIGVTYAPTYNYYGEAPQTVYEHSFVFNQHETVQRSQTNARLLFGAKTETDDDNVVNLISMWGNVSKADVSTVSFDTYSGKVNNTSVQNPTLRLPTQASESTWRTVLNISGDDPDAKGLSVADGYVTIELEGTYNVVCTEVGFDREPPAGVQSLGSGSGGSSGGGGSGTPTSSPTPTATPTATTTATVTSTPTENCPGNNPNC